MPFAAALVRDLLRRAPAGSVPFLAVGLAGLALDTLVFTLVSGLGASPALARAVSLAAATVLTWTLNRRLSFARTDRNRAGELGRYALVALAGQGFSYGLFLLLVATAPVLPHAVALWIGAVLAAGVTYAGQRWFTFAPARTA